MSSKKNTNTTAGAPKPQPIARSLTLVHKAEEAKVDEAVAKALEEVARLKQQAEDAQRALEDAKQAKEKLQREIEAAAAEREKKRKEAEAAEKKRKEAEEAEKKRKEAEEALRCKECGCTCQKRKLLEGPKKHRRAVQLDSGEEEQDEEVKMHEERAEQEDEEEHEQEDEEEHAQEHEPEDEQEDEQEEGNGNGQADGSLTVAPCGNISSTSTSKAHFQRMTYFALTLTLQNHLKECRVNLTKKNPQMVPQYTRTVRDDADKILAWYKKDTTAFEAHLSECLTCKEAFRKALDKVHKAAIKHCDDCKKKHQEAVKTHRKKLRTA